MLTLTLYFRKKFRNLNLESIYKLQMGKFTCIHTNRPYFLIPSILMFLVTRHVHSYIQH